MTMDGPYVTIDDRLPIKPVADPPTEPATPVQPRNTIPGWEGSMGPFARDYNRPHVYARDIHSGAGNCVCGGHLGHRLHVQAAPGVDIPVSMRT